ncbi:MAG: phage holin family protein [Betaproteobacteria bacterium]
MDARDGAERGTPLKPAILRVAAGALALARTRLELAGVELALERQRLTSIVALCAAGAVLATLAVATLTLGIVVYFWDTYRYEAIGALVVLYGALAAAGFLRAAAIVRLHPTPFAGTIAEFEKDRALLTGARPPSP